MSSATSDSLKQMAAFAAGCAATLVVLVVPGAMLAKRHLTRGRCCSA